MLIQKPVRFIEKERVIVDANNKGLLDVITRPSLTMQDIAEIGEEVVLALNLTVTITEPIGEIVKKRGNPNFHKVEKNPYSRN